MNPLAGHRIIRRRFRYQGVHHRAARRTNSLPRIRSTDSPHQRGNTHTPDPARVEAEEGNGKKKSLRNPAGSSVGGSKERSRSRGHAGDKETSDSSSQRSSSCSSSRSLRSWIKSVPKEKKTLKRRRDLAGSSVRGRSRSGGYARGRTKPRQPPATKKTPSRMAENKTSRPRATYRMAKTKVPPSGGVAAEAQRRSGGEAGKFIQLRFAAPPETIAEATSHSWSRLTTMNLIIGHFVVRSDATTESLQ